MKLLFHYHCPAIRKENSIFIYGFLGVFIDSISPFFEEIVLLLHKPRQQQMKEINYKIKSDNIRLIELDTHSSILNRYINFIPFLIKLIKASKSSDHLLLRISTPYLPFISIFWKKKISLLAVSDANAGLDQLNQPKLRKLLIRAWAGIYYLFEINLAKKSNILATSDLLYRKFSKVSRKVEYVRTTTVNTQDIWIREDTCLNKEYKILYSGRIAENKGILELIDAIAILRAKNVPVRLDIVGFFSVNSDIEQKLNCKIKKYKLNEFIVYRGFCNVGIELLSWYRKSDIFVLPTKSKGEGFPRVLWEAMASSIPIVVSDISGIKDTTLDAVRLTKPGDANDIAESLLYVIENGEYRRSIIKKALDIVRKNTIEPQSEKLSELIKNY